jgi:hypothetical protein
VSEPRLTPTEAEHLAGLLQRLRDVMGNAGCNDYVVRVSPESRAMLAEIEKDGDEEDTVAERLGRLAATPDGGLYYTSDFSILHHMVKRLGLPKAPEGIGER